MVMSLCVGKFGCMQWILHASLERMEYDMAEQIQSECYTMAKTFIHQHSYSMWIKLSEIMIRNIKLSVWLPSDYRGHWGNVVIQAMLVSRKCLGMAMNVVTRVLNCIVVMALYKTSEVIPHLTTGALHSRNFDYIQCIVYTFLIDEYYNALWHYNNFLPNRCAL